MDIKVRKLITCNRIYHPLADLERLPIMRENSGRGLIQLELANKTTTRILKKYLYTTRD